MSTRGVELIGVDVQDGAPVLTMLCDCATVTEIVLPDAHTVVGAAEFAYTCDGCESSHWVKFERTTL